VEHHNFSGKKPGREPWPNGIRQALEPLKTLVGASGLSLLAIIYAPFRHRNLSSGDSLMADCVAFGTSSSMLQTGHICREINIYWLTSLDPGNIACANAVALRP
jgi:hypothetical protein